MQVLAGGSGSGKADGRRRAEDGRPTAGDGRNTAVCGRRRPSALRCDHDGPIHAVVTDLIMPHMDGRELAERVLERQPAARIIYSSGYAGDVVSRHGALPAGVAFVQKPYTIDVLLSRIRETLDAS